MVPLEWRVVRKRIWVTTNTSMSYKHIDNVNYARACESQQIHEWVINIYIMCDISLFWQPHSVAGFVVGATWPRQVCKHIQYICTYLCDKWWNDVLCASAAESCRERVSWTCVSEVTRMSEFHHACASVLSHTGMRPCVYACAWLCVWICVCVCVFACVECNRLSKRFMIIHIWFMIIQIWKPNIQKRMDFPEWVEMWFTCSDIHSNTRQFVGRDGIARHANKRQQVATHGTTLQTTT